MFYKLNLLFRRLNLMLHDFNVVNLETIVMAATIDLPIYDLIKLHRHGEIAITNFIYYLRAPRPSQGDLFLPDVPNERKSMEILYIHFGKILYPLQDAKRKKILLKTYYTNFGKFVLLPRTGGTPQGK